MKTLLIFMILAPGFGAMAQQASARKEVLNEGRQLRIRVDVAQPGQYSRSFGGSAMEAGAVKAPDTQVPDSLSQPARPAAPEPTDNGRVGASMNRPLSPGDVTPSSVLFREDKENGRLWMQYIFRKNDEELVVERTVNVPGKTERAKQAIIRETERSLSIKIVTK